MMSWEANEGVKPLSELAAFSELYEAHRPRLLAMLRRRIDPKLAPRLDAEDILHETFLLARRRWPRPARDAMTPYAWLYRLALDCLIEAWRHESRDLRDLRRELPWPEHSSVQLGMGLVGTGTRPSEAVAGQEARGRIHEALDRLSPRDREIVWMRHFDDLSYDEIAAILGITSAAATTRHARALRRLKCLLSGSDSNTPGGP